MDKTNTASTEVKFLLKSSDGFNFMNEILKYLTTAIVACIIIRFAMPIVLVAGRSMEPTYIESDIVICNGMDKTYERGDTIVFKGINIFQGDLIIKRIAGIPGDIVDMDLQTGVIRVNDKIVIDEENAGLPNEQHILNFPITVPDGYLFVLGDNQPQSTDSRCESLGLIPIENVIGVAKVRIPISLLTKN